jgi:endonuclease/exonuclease/phosphatase family metal-dependent hydrolase
MKAHLYALTGALILLLNACGDETAEKPLLDSTSVNGTGSGFAGSPVSTEIKKDKPSVLRIMTFNIKGIPCLDPGAAKTLLATVGVKKCPLTDDNYQRSNDARFAAIAEKLRELARSGNGPDVVLLQEAFYSKNALFTNQGVRSLPDKVGYPYFAWGPEGTVDNGVGDYWNLVKQDQPKLKGLLSSGLLVLSRYPIQAKEVLLYGNDCAIEDCISNKAAMLVRISAPAIGSVDILNTHAQAQAAQGEVRKKQFARMAPFVKQTAGAPFVFLGGDFNAKTAPEYAEITQLKAALPTLKDGGQECANKVNGCAVQPGPSAARLGGDIYDHVFSLTTAPFAARPRRAFIYDWTLNGTAPLSDHKAVMMEYELAAE